MSEQVDGWLGVRAVHEEQEKAPNFQRARVNGQWWAGQVTWERISSMCKNFISYVYNNSV